MKLSKKQINIEPFSYYSVAIRDFDFSSRINITLDDFLDCDNAFYDNIGEILSNCKWNIMQYNK